MYWKKRNNLGQVQKARMIVIIRRRERVSVKEQFDVFFQNRYLDYSKSPLTSHKPKAHHLSLNEELYFF
jgi:hypothetical protein